MTRHTLLAALVAAVAWSATTAAQNNPKAGFDDAMKLVQKCRVDDLRALITGSPVGAASAGAAIAAANAVTIDPSTIKSADGTPLVVAAAETDCVEGMRILINAGAELTDTDKDGRTALHAAAAKSTSSMVQLLVEHKADVNAKTKAGDTPLSLAKTNNYKGKTDQRDKIVKFLTSKGAKDKS
ncbi:MAG TPA: ankyrin repeat domain-containing protein [Vicinamibacterales bacterium]|nr:ankyrin repeat domain-containing protein [Vicinamibacterales bacterium]